MTAKTYLALIVILLCIIFVVSITGCAFARMDIFEIQENGEMLRTKIVKVRAFGGSVKVKEESVDHESTLRVPDINILSGVIPR